MGYCSPCYNYIAIKVSQEMRCNVDIYSTRRHLLVIFDGRKISFTFLEHPAQAAVCMENKTGPI